MRAVFVDGHRVRDAGVHFGTATGDLRIPCFSGAGIGSCVEAADQFQRRSGTLLDRKAEGLGEHVGGGHRFSLTGSRPPVHVDGASDLPDGYLDVHAFTVDANRNLHGGDNQYGRTQKFVPKAGVDPALVINPPWVAR